MTPEELKAAAAAVDAIPPVRFQNDPVTPDLHRSLNFTAPGQPTRGSPADAAFTPAGAGGGRGELGSMVFELCARFVTTQDEARLHALVAWMEAAGDMLVPGRAPAASGHTNT